MEGTELEAGRIWRYRTRQAGGGGMYTIAVADIVDTAEEALTPGQPG